MNKRIAYIVLSYPLFYDYKNQAPLSENDLYESPNPILESPLGLMILYDELWFLCESLCPSNMRTLPYVRYVDKMYPDLYYEGIDIFNENFNLKINYRGLSYSDILDRMNLSNNGDFRLDNHSRAMKIGNIMRSGNADEYNLAFDIYIFMALREQNVDNIELIINSKFCMNQFTESNNADIVEKIIIPNIPNYLNQNGPYHPCIEELRENKYLTDFRKWIIENHNTIQKSEVNEICTDVDRIIKDTKERVFSKYLEDNSKYVFFKSSGKTIVKTVVGIASAPFSIADAIVGITINGKNAIKVNNDRWQGFVIQSRNIADYNKL